MNQTEQSRRDFLKFLGAGAVGLVAATTGLGALQSCSTTTSSSSQLSKLTTTEQQLKSILKLTPVAPSTDDQLILSPELSYQILLSFEDALGNKGNKNLTFGFNNDYVAFFPLKGKKKKNTQEGILWVNHEYPAEAIYYPGLSEKQVFEEQKKVVGGSLVHLKEVTENNAGKMTSHWKVIKNSSYNRRLDGNTQIPFAGNAVVAGKKNAIGTFANCAGGVTPWNTLLTCEENIQDYYGDVLKDTKTPQGAISTVPSERYKWDSFESRPKEHYGWVVEVNPFTGKAVKHTSLGRFAHECATTVKAKDGRTVVYMGDDKDNMYIYKFISAEPNDLAKGELFVADTKQGNWLSMDWNKQPKLQQHFKDQLEVLIFCREAATLIGATPQDRPEDVEIDPKTGDIFVALTNNFTEKRPHGSILKIKEQGADHLSEHFTAEIFLLGGDEIGLSCPDNLAFDPQGNLWVTSDISGSKINKSPYTERKNNGLFVVPITGPQAGRAIQVASAPVGAELTGPCFTADGKTLFLSVQHPGEGTKDPTSWTSHWPKGGNEIPRPSVVAINLNKLN